MATASRRASRRPTSAAIAAVDAYDQARATAAVERSGGGVNDAHDRQMEAWEAFVPHLQSPAALLAILQERPAWFAGAVDIDTDRVCIATLGQCASPTERADLLTAVATTPKARIERICDLIIGTMKEVCSSAQPTLAGYAARGEDRRPIDAWITAQDMYHFEWIRASRPVAGGGPSTIMQVLQLADETTRQAHQNAAFSQQHVLATELRGGGGAGRASPRYRLRLDLLAAWHTNGMATDVAASVLTPPLGYRHAAANQARVEQLAVIGHLPAEDIPAAGAWVIQHTGPEPTLQPDDRRHLSDWHAQQARDAEEDHRWVVRPYHRDHIFLAVVAGLSDACCRHGARRLDDAARQQLAQIGMDLVDGPRPQDVEQSTQRLQAAGLALLASLGDPTMP